MVEENGIVLISVETNTTLERAVVVNITVESSTASASDFSLLNTSLTFTAGEVNKVAELTTAEDGVLESEEVIQVSLQSTDAAVEVVGINPIIITIIDNSSKLSIANHLALLPFLSDRHKCHFYIIFVQRK